MAEISLRAYNREIEELIENGQTEEAIAHCKYILRQFPKHIDTYRSLGKAYLEAKRYSEAADILQRVLSVFPDDRVSQLGMSIIREDEGNLDAAIYHMERAFEVQPSNAAIQEELRRLYGRRDGVEPSKVRLTRGALVRMYERGQLYPQAIAEAKAALAEDPQRVDLMVVLARMYYTTGKKVEASEVCSRLLTRLPYCFEANRILAEILTTTSHPENVKVYRQRLQSLDPYIAFTSPEMPDSNQVADTSVMLEKLEWHPSQETGQIPEWTQTVGIGFEPEEETLPSWLDTIPQTMPAVKPESASPIETVTQPSEQELPSTAEVEPQTMPEEQPKEEILPAWMSEAGWAISEEKESIESIVEFGEEGEDVEPAELPDWVKSLAPQPQPESPTEQESKEELEALEKILPPLFETPETPVEPAFEELPASEEISLPVELPEFHTPVEEPQTTLPQAALSEQTEPPLPTELVDLFAQAEEFGMTPPQVEPLAEEMQGLPEQPAFTEKVAGEPSSIEQSTIDELDIDAAMAWLENLAARQGAEEETLITPPEQRLEQPPEWVQQQTESIEIPPQSPSEQEALPSFEKQPALESEFSPFEGETSQKDIDEAFAWLETLAARQGAEEGLLTTPEERRETPPEWIAQEQIEQPAGTALETPKEELVVSEELPDWLKILETPESEQPTTEVIQETTGEALPAWLREIEAEEPPPEQEGIKAYPEWVEETEPVLEVEKQIPQVFEELEPEQQTQSEQTGESQLLEGELPAWLRGIEMPAVEATIEPTQPVPTMQEYAAKTEEAPALEWGEEAISESEAVEAESKLEEGGKSKIIEELPSPPIIETPLQELSPEMEITQEPLMETEITGEEIVEFSPVSEMLPEEAPSFEQTEITPETEQPQMVGELQPITGEEPPQIIESTAQLEEEMLPETIQTPTTIAQVSEIVTITEESKLQTAEEKLQEAQAELAKGKLQSALEKYSELIESEIFLEQTIHDIRDALYRYPLDIGLWQALGDAYLRGNRLQDALDAYTKAEELIR